MRRSRGSALATAIALCSASWSTCSERGRFAERSPGQSLPLAAASCGTSRRNLGGQSQDHEPTAPTGPGRDGRVPAENRLERVPTEAREHLDLMRFLDGPCRSRPPKVDRARVDLSSWASMKLPIELSVRSATTRWCRFSGEPQPPRRVVRLLFANWLAQAEPPVARRHASRRCGRDSPPRGQTSCQSPPVPRRP